jgi:hypothetical protein
MLLASAAGGADDETAVFCATAIGEREIDPSRKRNINQQRGKERVSMSSLYRDKNNFGKPTAAHDFSPELGIDYTASGWWAILKLFPRSPSVVSEATAEEKLVAS